MVANALKVRQLMTERVVAVEPDATVAEAIARMEQNGIHELPVMSKSELRGWFSYRTLRRRGGIPSEAKISTVMDPPRRIEKDADVFEAAHLMIHNNVEAMSVSDGKGKIVGILSRTDVLKAALEMPAVANLIVENVMNTELETTRETEAVDKAMSRLRDLQVNQLLAVDDQGRLQGHVSLDDLARTRSSEHDKGASTGGRGGGHGHQTGGERKMGAVEVRSLIRESPTVNTKATVRDAIQRMVATRNHFVAVTQDGVAVGIVSRSNIVERVARLKPEPGVLCQIVGLAEHVESGVLDGIYDVAKATLKKITTEVEVMHLTLHYKVYKAKSEGDSKYSLTAHLATNQKFLVAKADAWDPLEATTAAFEILEERVRGLREKRLEKRKAPSVRKTEFYTTTASD